MIEHISGLEGEGLIIRAPNSLWIPERCHSLVKVKKLHDDEATVTGYTTGRETDKGSKLLGMMGALVVDFYGHRLELSGFTDAERRLEGKSQGFSALIWACGLKKSTRYFAKFINTLSMHLFTVLSSISSPSTTLKFSFNSSLSSFANTKYVRAVSSAIR